MILIRVTDHNVYSYSTKDLIKICINVFLVVRKGHIGVTCYQKW